MKRLALVAMSIVVCCSLGIALTRAIGSVRPRDPGTPLAAVVRDTRMIDGVWCWRDICPEKTSIGDAKALVKRNTSGEFALYSDQSGSFYWNVRGLLRVLVSVFSTSHNRTIDRVLLNPRSDSVLLGDVLQEVGQPRQLYCYWDGSARRWEIYLRTDSMYITVFSESGTLRPALEVQFITLEGLTRSAGQPGFRWAGFQRIPLHNLPCFMS